MTVKALTRAQLPNTFARNELKRVLHQKRVCEIKAERKWQQLKLPEEPLQAHPEAVSFLVESGLVFSIVMFKHGIQVDERGMPLIKMNGVWTAWEQVHKKLIYDPVTSTLQSRDEPNRYWNYISPQGLVPKNPYSQTLYRIEKLDESALHAIQNTASEFWKTHPEVDVGKEKSCTLQLVSTTKDYLPRNWLTNQLNDYYPQHTTIRLIDSKGNVYSFGMQVTKKFEEHLQKHPRDWLATGYASICQPDFEESRPFDERYVTSIPITQERFTDIVTFVNEVNTNPGMRFCFLNQNCNSFGVAMGHLAGVDIDTTIGMPELILKLFPRLRDVPVLGAVINRISRCVNAIVSYTPTPIAKVFKVLTSVALYLPRKVMTFAFTLLFLCFGAHKEIEPQQLPNGRKIQELTHFSRLISSFFDLFNEEKLVMHHSFKLVEWQRRHSFATKRFRYDGTPKMCV